jgi:hypothetical protein
MVLAVTAKGEEDLLDPAVLVLLVPMLVCSALYCHPVCWQQQQQRYHPEAHAGLGWIHGFLAAHSDTAESELQKLCCSI